MIRYGRSPRQGLGGANRSQNQDQDQKQDGGEEQDQRAPHGRDMNAPAGYPGQPEPAADNLASQQATGEAAGIAGSGVPGLGGSPGGTQNYGGVGNPGGSRALGGGPDTGTGSTGATGAHGSPAHGGGNNDLHYTDMPGVEDSTIMHGNPTPYAADMRDEPSGHTRVGDLSVAGGSGGSGGGGSDVLDTRAGPSGPMPPTPSVEDTGSAGSPSNEHDVSATAPHAIDHAPHRAPEPGGVNEPGPEAQP